MGELTSILLDHTIAASSGNKWNSKEFDIWIYHEKTTERVTAMLLEAGIEFWVESTDVAHLKRIITKKMDIGKVAFVILSA